MSFDSGEYDPHGELDALDDEEEPVSDFFSSIEDQDNTFVSKELGRFGNAHGGSLDHFYDDIITKLEGGNYE